MCANYQFLDSQLQICLSLPSFVIAELDPGNISPLPANEMLHFANRGHWSHTAQPQQQVTIWLTDSGTPLLWSTDNSSYTRRPCFPHLQGLYRPAMAHFIWQVSSSLPGCVLHAPLEEVWISAMGTVPLLIPGSFNAHSPSSWRV